MRNTMEIEGYRAVIQFDPDIDLFRGEFVGLNGGADFYAPDVAGLRREGAASLEVFLDMCREDGVEPGGSSPASSTCASRRSCTRPSRKRPPPTARASTSGSRTN